MNTRLDGSCRSVAIPVSRRTVRSRIEERTRYSRIEVLWAWASLVVLIICWDAARRLDQHVSLPRIRIAHAVEMERDVQRAAPAEL